MISTCSRFRITLINVALWFDWPLHAFGASPRTPDPFSLRELGGVWAHDSPSVPWLNLRIFKVVNNPFVLSSSLQPSSSLPPFVPPSTYMLLLHFRIWLPFGKQSFEEGTTPSSTRVKQSLDVGWFLWLVALVQRRRGGGGGGGVVWGEGKGVVWGGGRGRGRLGLSKWRGPKRTRQKRRKWSLCVCVCMCVCVCVCVCVCTLSIFFLAKLPIGFSFQYSGQGLPWQLINWTTPRCTAVKLLLVEIHVYQLRYINFTIYGRTEVR